MDEILSVWYGFLLRKSGFKRAKTGEIPAYRATIDPRYVARAAQGGGHPGSAVMGRRPAARGLPWVRVVSVWEVMVSVWRPLGGRSKRLVSVYVPP